MTDRRASELGLLIIPRFMLAAILAVAVLHVAVMYMFPDQQVYSWPRELFDLGVEGNVPTWLACVFWLIISASAFLCYSASKGLHWFYRLPWIGVALVFGAASCDEVAEIHENVGHYLQKPQLATGNPKFLQEGSPGSPWIGFYAPILIAVVIAMLIFFYRTLKLRYFLTACGGFLCFCLAISMDFYQGMYEPNKLAIAQALHADNDWLVDASIYVEELLELLGMTLLSWAFLGRYETLKREATEQAQS